MYCHSISWTMAANSYQKKMIQNFAEDMLVFALLDAACYAKEEQDKVDETIKNAFIKADLRISLDSAVTETCDNNEFLKLFKNLYITATEQDNDEFVAIDNESSYVFHEEILEDANPFF